MIKQEIKKLLKDAIVEKPKQEELGDYSTNIALVLAKKKKKDPNVIAEEIIASIKSDLFEKIENKNGFINFFISKKYLQDQVKEILKGKYNKFRFGKGKINVEYISANPTGPLTIANARGGPIGDALANVLQKAGNKVTKSFYINNHGNQIKILGHSVLKDSEAEYKGEYIDEMNKKLKGDPYTVGKKAADIIVDMMKTTTDRMGIKYDEWISENDLYKKGAVDKVLKSLKQYLYEKDGAVWFKSTSFGDNRDRVIIKSDKENTYLAGDLALHKYKLKKHDKAINIWGADHHGDVPGLKAGVEAMGYKGKLDILLYQFVTVKEKGENIRMSKRKGNYVTMDEMLNDVGPDVIKFFFLLRGHNTHLSFDMDLAKEQSERNPVFYVQYAHARICSILSKAKSGTCSMESLVQESELSLIKQLIRFPEIIEDIAKDYQVDRLTRYSLDIAKAFHRFYQECHVMCKEENIRKARLALITATKIVLKDVLDLMGISAPEKM